MGWLGLAGAGVDYYYAWGWRDDWCSDGMAHKKLGVFGGIYMGIRRHLVEAHERSRV